jgi:hypothetical protein
MSQEFVRFFRAKGNEIEIVDVFDRSDPLNFQTVIKLNGHTYKQQFTCWEEMLKFIKDHCHAAYGRVGDTIDVV